MPWGETLPRLFEINPQLDQPEQHGQPAGETADRRDDEKPPDHAHGKGVAGDADTLLRREQPRHKLRRNDRHQNREKAAENRVSFGLAAMIMRTRRQLKEALQNPLHIEHMICPTQFV